MTGTRKTLIDRPRIRVTYSHRSPDQHMGRFGGGWQWIVGFEASEGFRTVILNLLVCMVRIERKKVERPPVVLQCRSVLNGKRCDLNAMPHIWHQHDEGGGVLTWSDETPGATRA